MGQPNSSLSYEPWDDLHELAQPNSNSANGAVPAPEGIWVEELTEPEPMAYIVAGMMPRGHVTTVFGKGGDGKSHWSLLAALCICQGLPFFGHEVIQSPVLYLDAELDLDEFLRRAYRIQRGLGVTKLPPGLRYCSIASWDQAMIEAAAFPETVKILDSLTIALSADAVAHQAVIDRMNQMRSWGSTWAVDHTPKSNAENPGNTQTQFGSVFKRNLARSSFFLDRTGPRITVVHDKHNFGPLLAPWSYEESYTPTAVTFSDPLLGGPARQRILEILANTQPTTKELATMADIPYESCKVRCSELAAEGRIENSKGRWLLITGGRNLL